MSGLDLLQICIGFAPEVHLDMGDLIPAGWQWSCPADGNVPLQTHCGVCRGIVPHSQQQLCCHSIKFTLWCYWLDSLKMRQACKPLDFSPSDPEIRFQKSLCKKRSVFVQLLKAKGLFPLVNLQQVLIPIQIQSRTCQWISSSEEILSVAFPSWMTAQQLLNPSDRRLFWVLGLCVLPSLPRMGTAKALRKAGLQHCSIMHAIF